MEKTQVLGDKNRGRNSAFEVLRILAMFLIVVHHYSVHGVLPCDTYFQVDFGRGLLLQWMFLGGRFGIFLFVCISGYFLVESTFKWKHVFDILFKMWFYSVSIYVVLCLTGVSTFSLRSFAETLFPVLKSRWWFATVYLTLFCIAPFINVGLKSLSKKEYCGLLFVIVFIFMIVPTFTSFNTHAGYFEYFIIAYLTGAFIRLHIAGDIKSRILGLIITALSFLALYLSVPTLDLIGEKITGFRGKELYLADISSILVYLFCLGLVLIANGTKPYCNRFVNLISKTTFGVYLIHECGGCRELLWGGTIVDNSVQMLSECYWALALGTCILVFSVCSVVDLIREYTIGKIGNPLKEKIAVFSENCSRKFMDMIFKEDDKN